MSKVLPISFCKPSITYRWQSSDTVMLRLEENRSRKSFMSCDAVKEIRSVFFPGSNFLYGADKSKLSCVDIVNHQTRIILLKVRFLGYAFILYLPL